MTHQPFEPGNWRGRSDPEERGDTRRWYNEVSARVPDAAPGICLLGFASDEGVKRNQGRPGAANGPREIRRALGGLTWAHRGPCYDDGDVACIKGNLEHAQEELRLRLARRLREGHQTCVLGGGHEVAYPSFLGLSSSLPKAGGTPNIGIINFDAHLDLRNPRSGATSGTPFRQIAEHCDAQGWPFNYLALGINPSVNTRALFDYATDKQVRWVQDLEMVKAQAEIDRLVTRVDCLYVTVCMDVFPATVAPGVSAPAAVGVPVTDVLSTIRYIKRVATEKNCPVRHQDIAELNPEFDRDGMTARLAARVVWELLGSGEVS